jgi:hypothetical protein
MKGDARSVLHKVAASTQIYKGAIVSVSATGFLIPAADTVGTLVVGIANANVDNTGGADGALSCLVQKGVAGLRGGATPPTQAHVGRSVEVADDAGINILGTGNSISAGTLDSIGSDGLFYVKLYDQA